MSELNIYQNVRCNNKKNTVDNLKCLTKQLVYKLKERQRAKVTPNHWVNICKVKYEINGA